MSGRLVADAGQRIVGGEDRAEGEHELRAERHDEDREEEPAGPGDGVVRPGQDPREVQRQDAVALVAPEQLRRLRRAEQHDERRGQALVRVMPDRRVRAEGPAGARLRREGGDPDCEQGRQQREDEQQERCDLRPSTAPDAVRRSQGLAQEPDRHGRPTLARAVVALVAEVEDAPGRTGLDRHWKSSSRPRRRCSRRTSGRPRSATASRTRSHGRSSASSTSTTRPSTTACSPAATRRRAESGGPFLDLDREDSRPLGEVGQRRGPHEPARVDGHEEVAHALDLAEQVAGHDDRDPELRSRASDEGEHLVATGGIEPVGRLVEEQQSRVVDEGLGELDALAHARRVGAHRSIALLVQADVAEHLGGPLARGRGGQPGQARHLADEVGGRGVRRQAVGFRHVPDEPPEGRALGAHVVAEDSRPARGRAAAARA